MPPSAANPNQGDASFFIAKLEVHVEHKVLLVEVGRYGPHSPSAEPLGVGQHLRIRLQVLRQANGAGGFKHAVLSTGGR